MTWKMNLFTRKRSTVLPPTLEHGDIPARSEEDSRYFASRLFHEQGPFIGLLAVLLLSLWPLRSVLGDIRNNMLGVLVDSTHLAWGYWHLTNGHRVDAFWPVGVDGPLMGAPSLLLACVVTSLVSAQAAATVVSISQMWLTLLGVGFLARRFGGGPWAPPLAALLMLCGRPLLASIGFGVPEGAALGWYALALLSGLSQRRGRGVLQGGVTGLLTVCSLLENPYSLLLLVPTVVIVGVQHLRNREHGRLLSALVAGSLALGGWLGGFHQEKYHDHTEQEIINYHGLKATIERFNGRAHSKGLLFGAQPLTYKESELRVTLSRGVANFVGLVPVILSLLALSRPRARGIVAVAAVLLLFALGSRPLGDEVNVMGPFFYLSLAFGLVERTLTQPIRYLVPFCAALSIASSLYLASLIRAGKRRWVLAITACALLEALSVGGLATTIPPLPMSKWSCLEGLPPGPVTTVVRLRPMGSIHASSLALQLIHKLPGTHHGIGSWRERSPREKHFDQLLTQIEIELTVDQSQMRHLADAGVKWLLLPDKDAVALPVTRACGGVSVVDLEPYRHGPR